MARNISFKQAINEALDLEMRRDPTVRFEQSQPPARVGERE